MDRRRAEDIRRELSRGAKLVSVQAVPTRSSRAFEVAFCRIYVACGCRWIKDSQQRELEAGRVEAAQLDVAAVSIRRVGGPPLPDAFGTISLADLLAPIPVVGDEIDPHDR